MAEYSYEIGANYAARENVEDIISIPPSGVEFNYHSILRSQGDGKVVGDGYAICVWHFRYLSWTDHSTMLGYIGSGNESNDVVIRTRRQDGTYEYYDAIIHRPRVPEELRQHSAGWHDISFRFTRLEVYTP